MKGKEVEVVKLLIENKGKDLSINQIAKLMKKDYKNAHNIVSRLAKMQLVGVEPFGGSHKVFLINKIHPLIFEAEYMRRNELLRNRDILIMNESFNKARSTLYVLLVFGSYAKKTQNKHSDIDLMFIVPDDAEESMEREINSIAGILPLKLHINIFKEKDFRAMKDTKKVTVGSEAISNNVILHGIEMYYGMVS